MAKKRTQEQFVNEIQLINPSILVVGFYDGKDKRVTVKCKKCNYKWYPVANSLLRGYGCPHCAGNAPKTTKKFIEELSKKNKDISVLGEYIGANEKILVKCNKCGKEWSPTPSKLLNGRGCPDCSKNIVTSKRIAKFIGKDGSLSDCYPELLDEWDYEENRKRDLIPSEITKSSNRIASWKCKTCGCSYDAMISNRTRVGSGCPVCAGKIVVPGVNDLATVAPDLVEEWDYEKNNSEHILLDEVSKGSETKANWICKICGNKWKANIYSRYAGTGCPKCSKETSTSLPEQSIFFYLKKLYPDAVNSYRPDWIKPSEIDIYLPSVNMGIEYDGEGFHTSPSKDEAKDRLCENHGIRILHVREPKCPPLSDSSLVYIRPRKSADQIDEMICEIVNIINLKCGSDNLVIPNFEKDRIQIYNQYLTRIKDNSIVNNSDAMLDWDYEKNQGIKPEMLSTSSNMRVWWKCHICGHETLKAVSSHRTHQCAVCGRVSLKSPYREKIIESGRNDVEYLRPDLAAEWIKELNNGVKPSECSYQSRKRINWKCKKCGYVWTNSVANRVNGEGCPFCAGKTVVQGKNDLATVFPELARQWIECVSDNKATPQSVSSCSNKKVLWQCQICKGKWVVSINSRTRGGKMHGCPYCLNEKVLPGFNDLKTLSPEVASEWNYEKNGELRPENILNKSSRKVWWKCHECGYEWRTSVASRTGSNHSGCKECSKKKAGKQFCKKVVCISIDNRDKREFNSISEAAKEVGLSSGAIVRALKRDKGTSGGYYWEYKDKS